MRLSLPHPGSLVALAILALVTGGFIALATIDGGSPALLSIGPYLTRVLAFSVIQASLSTLLSVGLGIALALALARRRFPGRDAVLAALSTTMVIPTIVAVFAVLAVYGRSGWLAGALQFLGVSGDLTIFGYPGILIAHVFLNAPYVARITLDGLSLVPAEQWRLATALGFTPGQIFRHLDWPVLRTELPGIAGLVFLLCFKSFAVVLALGGGPARATLEVAIYEALKIDLDFGRAAWLALIQLVICLSLTGLLNWIVTRPPAAHTTRSHVERPDAAIGRLKVLDWLILAAGALFLVPLAFSVLSGVTHLLDVVDADLLQAAATSLAISTAAAILACLMALALGSAARRQRLVERTPRLAALYDFLPNTLLAIPPFALTAGLFLLIRHIVDPAAAGLILLPLINSLAAVPFVYRAIAPKLMTAEERYGRVAASLGMTGLSKLTIMDWPLLKRPLASGFALAMALSFGDFGIIALFGGPELRTLPYLLYERLGAYRLEEAASIGLLIVLAAFVLAHLSGRLSHAGD
ncbi:ABC transporter permease subunit [Microvirga subterranea]|uniref:Thiamine transport system permease protein n=1 Tax=Microvirga subterranea TaxID=186651 RepID=A0A370HTD0_9HYPH|nr:ABC transporter permease subunit [Microvirga subterranea]RDI61782.1 thiamine transport system permease protein [Microvirga subterranea]